MINETVAVEVDVADWGILEATAFLIERPVDLIVQEAVRTWLYARPEDEHKAALDIAGERLSFQAHSYRGPQPVPTVPHWTDEEDVEHDFAFDGNGIILSVPAEFVTIEPAEARALAERLTTLADKYDA